MPSGLFDQIAQPDLAQPILRALLNNWVVVSQLPSYAESVTVFTRRPPPPDAGYPMILISPDIARANMDGLCDLRPQFTRDVSVYGINQDGVSYRAVESIARTVFDQFHRMPSAIRPPDGWTIAAIEAHGPIPAPVDDDMYVGRIVTLNILLAHLL